VLSEGGANVRLLKTDIHNWNITFVDTGLHASIAERLRAVRHLLRDDEMFLANYGDTVTDVNLHAMVGAVRASRAMGSFIAVKPNYSFHVVSVNDDGLVREISDVTKSDMWINGGYFVMRSEVLDDLRPGEELVEEPFQRLIAADRLIAHRHEGFWAPMDTLKEQQWLESLHESGQAPWELWTNPGGVEADAPRLASA
jgi:glucose-1-phosphate cytidylyltransferase